MAIGCHLPMSGLVNKLGDCLFKALDDGRPHCSSLPRVFVLPTYYPPPHSSLPPAGSLLSQASCLRSCPFLTWIALPEPFLPIEMIALKILSDATSCMMKPYPVPEAKSYILSLCAFPFCLHQGIDFTLLCMLIAYLPHNPRGPGAC